MDQQTYKHFYEDVLQEDASIIFCSICHEPIEECGRALSPQTEWRTKALVILDAVDNYNVRDKEGFYTFRKHVRHGIDKRLRVHLRRARFMRANDAEGLVFCQTNTWDECDLEVSIKPRNAGEMDMVIHEACHQLFKKFVISTRGEQRSTAVPASSRLWESNSIKKNPFSIMTRMDIEVLSHLERGVRFPGEECTFRKVRSSCPDDVSGDPLNFDTTGAVLSLLEMLPPRGGLKAVGNSAFTKEFGDLGVEDVRKIMEDEVMEDLPLQCTYLADSRRWLHQLIFKPPAWLWDLDYVRFYEAEARKPPGAVLDWERLYRDLHNMCWPRYKLNKLFPRGRDHLRNRFEIWLQIRAMLTSREGRECPNRHVELLMLTR